jgi:hypothetical protein
MAGGASFFHYNAIDRRKEFLHIKQIIAFHLILLHNDD